MYINKDGTVLQNVALNIFRMSNNNEGLLFLDGIELAISTPNWRYIFRREHEISVERV